MAGILTAVHAETKIFKIATLSPEGSIWMEKMKEGAERVAEETGNRVTFKFYPGGVMGSDQAVLRKIRISQLQGGALLSGSLSTIYPDIQIYSLPFMFKSYEEIDYVRDRMDQALIDGLEENGWIAFGIAEGGFAYVMSNTPIQSIEDLKSKKVWVPDNDTLAINTVKHYGISPIPLSVAEVRAGLQTGLIDTIGASPIGAIALQWHTQVKFVMDAPMMYLYAMLVINKSEFQKVSPEDQTVVRHIMNAVFAGLNEINRRDNIKASDTLANIGIQFVKPGPDQLKQWKSASEATLNTLENSSHLSAQMISTLKTFLTEFRSQSASR
jgi:TRAP-type C4-dicarboxylate transport system substrate-binding protein